MYKKRLLCIILTICFVVSQMPLSVFAVNTRSDVSQEMLRPNFWTNKLTLSDDIIMSYEEISELNQKNEHIKLTYVVNLKDYTDILNKAQLTNRLNEYEFPSEDRYMGNDKVSKEYYDNIKVQMNFQGIKDYNNIFYGCAVKRTNIRTYPTSDVSYETPNDFECDLFQESVLQVAEPIRILHKSLDGSWFFIQTYNCIGWVKTCDIAVAKSKEQWLSYVYPKDFLVITADNIILAYNPYSPQISQIELGMGTKIPLTLENIPSLIDNQTTYGSFVLNMPICDANGNLEIKQALIPEGSDVSVGYLKYTKRNILNQAFKCQGKRYGWGGMFNSRDCSSYVMDIYRCFGIMFPRNTNSQECSTGRSTRFDTFDNELRSNILDNIPAGSLLYMKNHVLMYLGKDNGKHYAISALYAQGDPNKPLITGGLEKKIVNSVTVMSLDVLLRKTGNLFYTRFLQL